MIETESIIITASESPVQTFPINTPFSSYLADNKDISKDLLTCIFARVYPKLGKWQFRSTFYVRGGINCHSLKGFQCQKGESARRRELLPRADCWWLMAVGFLVGLSHRQSALLRRTGPPRR